MAAVSDIGRQRASNEDNYLLGRECSLTSAPRSVCACEQPCCGWVLAGLFDGMGGGEAGEWASRAAALSLARFAETDLSNADRSHVEAGVRGCFADASRAIAEKRAEAAVLGTTGSVLCADGSAFKVFYLGDSRLYLYRDGTLYQITRDHTLAALKVEAGIYGPDDPQAEADRHRLTEYIGCGPPPRGVPPAESEWIAWQAGDRALLCSDGLYDMCSDLQIGEILSRALPPQETCALLADAACGNGGPDNVTCLIVEPYGLSAGGTQRP